MVCYTLSCAHVSWDSGILVFVFFLNLWTLFWKLYAITILEFGSNSSGKLVRNYTRPVHLILIINYIKVANDNQIILVDGTIEKRRLKEADVSFRN